MTRSSKAAIDRIPITAIIPTFNRAKYLRQAVESVLGQSFPPAQVIVVDDGSTDETHEVVSGFGSRVQYLSKLNGGKSTALNLGMQHASGEFIWIFDDDDIAECDALERLAAALAENPECGFSYGDYDLFTTDASGAVRQIPVSFPIVQEQGLYLALMERSFILQQGLLVRRSCYQEVGIFDETLVRSQDLDMMLRLARLYPGVKVQGITFHLRQHTGVRGSKAAPVSANRVVDGWVKSDRKIIRQIYVTHDLRDFVPLGLRNAAFPEDDVFTALLQRACILARKGLWTEAACDFRRASKIAQANRKVRLTEEERAILRRMFDLFSYAPHTFEEASEFRYALKHMKPASLRREMQAAILWSLPFSVGAALLHRQYANVRRFLRVGFCLATPYSILRTLFSRSFLDYGWDLVRSKLNRKAASTGATRQILMPTSLCAHEDV